jgi:hypothetical protein
MSMDRDGMTLGVAMLDIVPIVVRIQVNPQKLLLGRSYEATTSKQVELV